MQSHLNYEGYSRVSRKLAWYKDEMDGTPWPTWPETIFVTEFGGECGEKESVGSSGKVKNRLDEGPLCQVFQTF